jgi:hypothetical protein
VFLQEIFHEGDIFLRPAEPGNKFVSNGRLKILDVMFHFAIDDDGDIEFGFLFMQTYGKDHQFEIVTGFINDRRLYGHNTGPFSNLQFLRIEKSFFYC